MPKNKLQDYKFIFNDASPIVRSYKNKISAIREGTKLLKFKNQNKVIIKEKKNGKFETIKEIKND